MKPTGKRHFYFFYFPRSCTKHLTNTDSFQLPNYPKCKCYFYLQVKEAETEVPLSPAYTAQPGSHVSSDLGGLRHNRRSAHAR